MAGKLEGYGKKMDEMRREACERSKGALKRGAEMRKTYDKRIDEMGEEACKLREELWKKTSEILKHETKERGLQNELKMLKEERKRTENKTLRNHTVQIKQLEAKAGWSVRR